MLRSNRTMRYHQYIDTIRHTNCDPRELMDILVDASDWDVEHFIGAFYREVTGIKNLSNFRSMIWDNNKVPSNIDSVNVESIKTFFELIFDKNESESFMRNCIVWSAPLRYYAPIEYENLKKKYEIKFNRAYLEYINEC